MKKLQKQSIGFAAGKYRLFQLTTLVLLFLANVISAQDTIVLREDETGIPAKITEITLKEVKYKKSTNLNGPTYTLLKSDVQRIRYENGSEDVFAEESPAAKVETPYAPIPSSIDPKNTDLIITKGSRQINCVITRVDNYNIHYEVRRRGQDSRNVISLSEVSEYKKQGVTQRIATLDNIVVKDEDDKIIERRHYSGPRVGMTIVGPGAFNDALTTEGKRTAYSQFGWQFETRMFTLGNGLSGMFEFVPLAGGIDMGKIIPSVSGMIGLRTKEGYEFGIGPNYALYFGKNQMGNPYVSSNLGIVLAVGMSIKSGNVYFPVNLAFTPSVTKQTSRYNPTTRQNEVIKYDTGMKVSLLIGFNNRSR